MSDDLQNRGPQDRSRVSLDEDWEVRYWTEKFGVSRNELETAVAQVGPMASEVEHFLSSLPRLG